MEKLIESFDELKSGDVVLVPFTLTGEDIVGSVSAIIKSYKYTISDSKTGTKSRNYRDKNGVLHNITAESEGCKGDEMMRTTDIWVDGGSMHVTEIDDIKSMNIRKISKDHPKYDKDKAETGDFFGQLFGKMQEMEDNGEESENLGDNMMKALGSIMQHGLRREDNNDEK
jgi:hypothetical protein